MRRIYLSILLLLAGISCCNAIQLEKVRFHNEESDTTRINEILKELVKIEDSGQRVAAAGMAMLGTPYVAGTLEGEKEMLTIALDEVDCTTFVETALALAYTAGEGRTSWRDYIYNLERLRYRGGEMNGYASRLHYVSDWIVNNAHRGNIIEATSRMPECSYAVKTIDFMTANRDKYPALKNDAQYERMKDIEMGYLSHRFPYIKKERLNQRNVEKELRQGDVVAITTKIPSLDVSHMGIIVKEDGEVRLMHASSAEKKVIIDNLNLYDYLRRNRSATGIRVIRLME
ncbi:MAG: DUF1460 domain-containing protein [Pseudoflavonifractor sp.]|nr:DUF1460 domain-containing protein [Pseudoflavonifractor sp.]